jgi:NAD+ kinase
VKVLLFGIHIREEHEIPYIKEVIKECISLQFDVLIYGGYERELKTRNILSESFKTIKTHVDLLQERPDVVITLGGDGTILQAAVLVRDSGIPLMGINLGRLGFLASVEKKWISSVLRILAAGDFEKEQRTLLSLHSNLPLFNDFPFALNDFTLHKRDDSSMISIHVYIDDKPLNTYWADGIIISTPTGSTGYALSCGGPIAFPDSSNFIISAVAPHNLNIRPIVIADHHKLSVRVEGRAENYMCTLDGRYELISAAHQIELEKANFTITLIGLPQNSFMKTLSDKLMWGVDKRN